MSFGAVWISSPEASLGTPGLTGQDGVVSLCLNPPRAKGLRAPGLAEPDPGPALLPAPGTARRVRNGQKEGREEEAEEKTTGRNSPRGVKDDRIADSPSPTAQFLAFRI